MKFHKLGKTYQLIIKDGNDLERILSLDEALWMAMSAPVSAMTCDSRFLSMMDASGNGTICTTEIKNAIKWLLEVYPKKELINDCFSGSIKLEDINTACSCGQEISHSASYINEDMKVADPSCISLDTVRQFQSERALRPLNGDGITTLLTLTESRKSGLRDLLSQFVSDAVTATGGTKDLSGEMGITDEQGRIFAAAIRDYLGWLELGKDKINMPFGENTPGLYAIYQKTADAINEFFALCAIKHFDHRLTDKILHADGRPGILDPKDWPGKEEYLKQMPLSFHDSEHNRLSLADLTLINPYYREDWEKLVAQIIRPVLGSDINELAASDWEKIKKIFAGYANYRKNIQGSICEKISLENLHLYAGKLDELLDELHELSQRDLLVTNILNEAKNVEKLLLFLKYLILLCNNIVSMTSLYETPTRTLFERGKLVIDGRWFNLAFPVRDINSHSAMTAQSSLFVIYIQVEDTTPFTLALPVTIGNKGNLYVGKRGLFFDNSGKQYNAKITKVIVNPVCLKEAILEPFAKFRKIIETKIESLSKSSESVIETNMAKAVNDPKAIAAKTNSGGGDKNGMLVGIGVAFAALSSALAFICKTLSSMSPLAILWSILGLMFILIFPIVLLAVVKLSRQDLSPMLEGDGWAMNSGLRLTNHQRRTFSRHGQFPDDAKGTPLRISFKSFLGILIVLCVIWYLLASCRHDIKRHFATPPAPAVQSEVQSPAQPQQAAIPNAEQHPDASTQK